MDYMKILAYKAIRLCMRLLCIFPIRKNRVFFESYKGKSYSCNPKYISEYLQKHYPTDFELVWVLNDPDKVNIPEGIKVVKNHTIPCFYFHMTSKVIITNMTDDVFIPKRKKQIHINTWHAGGAYKKVGLSFDKTLSRLTVWQDRIVREETSVYLSSSALFTRYNIREAYQYEGDVICSGMPRNDIFFDEKKLAEIREKVSDILPLRNRIVVLFAPTFRGVFGSSEERKVSFPYDGLINEAHKEHKDIIILNRAHYSEATHMTTSEERIIDVSDYPDMQELLAVTDILVTDYSSSIWDFSLTGKPCVLFVPDIDEYMKNRGTYTPVEKWPGVVTKTSEELIDAVLHPNNTISRRIAEESLQYFESYEKGNAAEKVGKLIKEVVRNG